MSTLVPEAVLAAARRWPDRTAIAVGKRLTTYAELAGLIAALRRVIDDLPAGPIAGYFNHCAEGVAAFVAAMTGQHWFIPMAPILGSSRVSATIRQARPVAVLTTASLAGELTTHDMPILAVDALSSPGPPWPPGPPSAPGRLAYVIYTSGSTGVPKGVAISHQALAASTTARLSLYGEGGTLFLAAPLCFDSSISLFAPLSTGGTVRLSSTAADHDAVRLAAEVAIDASASLLLPSVYAELLEVWRDNQPSGLEVAIVAGEAVSGELVRRHFALAPARRLVNEYGPSEACVFCTSHDITPTDAGVRVPIGVAIDGYQVGVCRPDLSPTAPGEVGEIWVAGVGLAEGYVGDAAMTARRFRPTDHARRYLTGDLGCLRPDGLLEFRGRIDDQVKVRGIRVEMAEVEQALRAVAGVVGAVAVPVAGRVHGYYWGSGSMSTPPAPDERSMSAWLAVHSPSYLVPSRLRRIVDVPRTASGKVDRRALVAADESSDGSTGEPTDDRRHDSTAVSRASDVGASYIDQQLWPAVLTAMAAIGREVSPDEPFVAYADSLDAMRLAVRLHTSGWRVEPAALLDGRTLRQITAQRHSEGAAEENPPPGPLSPNQLGVWFEDSAHPGTTQFLVPLRLTTQAALDPHRLLGAVREVVRRHPVLGCRLSTVAGQPQLIENGEPPALELIDLDEHELPQLIAEEEATPIDLGRDPPMRATLARLPNGRCELLLSMHHIAFDGWSKLVLAADLARAYRGESTESPMDYRRYAARLRAADERGEFSRPAASAGRALAGLPSLRLRAVATPAFPAFVPAGRIVDIDAALTKALHQRARSDRTTLFVVLAAGISAALADVTGESRFVLGTLSANRSTPDLERVVGLLANIVPIAVNLDQDGEPVQRLRSAVVAALRYAYVPFGRVVAAARPQRTDGQFAPVLFEYFGQRLPLYDFAGVRADLADDGLQQGAVCELSMRVFPRADGLRAVVVRDASVVSAATMDALVTASLAAWRSLAHGSSRSAG